MLLADTVEIPQISVVTSHVAHFRSGCNSAPVVLYMVGPFTEFYYECYVSGITVKFFQVPRVEGLRTVKSVSTIFRRRYRAFQVLWDAGHVGPRGNIISGSYFDLSRHGSHVLFDKWFKEFDTDTFAFYYGSQPFVISKDLDLAKQILIKDFQKFRNRAVNTENMMNRDTQG